ncbi:MAG: hypothetical protein E4H23_10825 [Chrysiogenales bacterium]|nr:MAG: hypothetical protein E4H23_10825 [Chrysiogenales bacterium]
MKKFLRFCSWFFLSLFFVGCNQAGAGPITWIDIPSQDITLPLAPFSIVAHASDNDGIEGIEFHINGELEKSLAPRFEGSERLGWAEGEFSPLMYGIYRIDVKAIDGSGVSGPADTVIVTIAQAEAPATPIEIPGGDVEGEQATPIEIPGEDIEGEEVVKEPMDPIAVANRNANCREGPGTEYNIDGALLLNKEGDIVGRLADNSWFLITLPDGSKNCWISAITVDTQGEIDRVGIVSAPPPPALPLVAEESPPVDTETPGIFGSATSKTSMCASDTINANVVAYDAGGIKKIYASWRITDSNGSELQSGYVEYHPIPSVNNGYTAELGSFSYPGTLQINGTVEDNAGNKAYFNNSITIDCS